MRLDKKEDSKRMGILVFYDPQGIVDEYVLYLLEDLRTILSKLVIVCNGRLTYEGREKLEKYAEKIICRKNEGYDVAAWKKAILDYIGLAEIAQYDELVLFNDTFYGPFYSFREVFDKMDTKDIDFWGLTSHQEALDGFEKSEYGYIPDFIQTYFMAFRKKLISSSEFQEYWERIPEEMEYQDAVHYHEAVCTQKFFDQGYRWDTYIHTDELRVKRENSICYNTYLPDYMLIKKHLPILRRKIFVYPYDDYISYSGGEPLAKCMEYIENETAYDTDLIWGNLLRLYHMADLKQSLHLNYVLSNSTVQATSIREICLPETGVRAAVIIHSYYMDLLNDIYHYARQVPEYIDLYVTTGNEKKKKLIEAKFETLSCRNFQVILVENRGRDLAALLVGCKDIVRRYDYVCFTHDKKTSGSTGPLPIGKSFFYTAIENVLSSPEYIENIIGIFEQNRRLGVASPPGPLHNIYFGSIGREWTICYEKTKQLLEAFGIQAPISREKQPFVLGTSLWFRTDALQKLFAKDWSYEDFPEEPLGVDGTISHALERSFPYFAQDMGYYSAWIMTDAYASLEISNVRYLLSNTVNVQQEKHAPHIEHYFKHYMYVQQLEPCQAGTFYYDLGQGYDEEHLTRVFYKLDEAGDFTLAVHVERKYQGKIKAVRFDPLEDTPSMLALKDIRINDRRAGILSHNGMDIGNGYQWFESMDPHYILDIPDEEITDIEIAGTAVMIGSNAAEVILDAFPVQLTGLFWDDGSGYCEEHCIRKDIPLKKDGMFHASYKINQKTDIYGIRFDPAEGKKSVVTMKGIWCDGKKILDYSHNGRDIGGGSVYFETDDPCFMIHENFEGIDTVVVDGSMTIVPDTLAAFVK